MHDSRSPKHRPDELGWDLLSRSSEPLAAAGNYPGEVLALGASTLPIQPPLPAAELLAVARRLWLAALIRQRLFGRELFPDPAWNILLELFVAGEQGRDVTIKCACAAAGVPQSTALRHIAHLTEIRLITRHQNLSDARSAYLELTERARTRMVEFLTLTASCPDGLGA